MSRPYRTSCDDFTPASGADALSADDLAALLGRPPGAPWMLAADATHGDVAGEFEVTEGHEINVSDRGIASHRESSDENRSTNSVSFTRCADAP